MSNITVNALAANERHVSNGKPASGLVRIPKTRTVPARCLWPGTNGAFNNAIRALYRQLVSLRSEDGQPKRTIGLTSCYPHEGKTTVAACLASVAADNQRVMLIDANESRPSIHKAIRYIVFNRAVEANHVAYFEKTDERPAKVSPRDDGSSEQPTIDETRDLLRLLSSQFDLIVFDLPALDSASVLDWAPLLDGAVLVIESERVRWQVAAKGIDLLTQAGCEVLGTIVNKQREYIPQWLYRRL